jgi:hypothetical protein
MQHCHIHIVLELVCDARMDCSGRQLDRRVVLPQPDEFESCRESISALKLRPIVVILQYLSNVTAVSCPRLQPPISLNNNDFHSESAVFQGLSQARS